ncbi:hypothetical protein [Gryllotalpicola protaetiae]|uniref:Uncharacterized protein n=1 Tax=Gryllotalpicola protaetiae TaxID=2419771 RepID=A0A387BUX5_9MICO|nr:hypothetical protein [Gryllotalpicola protaetiae]AYG04769.1 hypothetical protein D7I44_15370 [Gryllotalpicola protaetiae]
MKTSSPRPAAAALLPLVVVPILAVTVIGRFDGVPDFVLGLVYGASIALMLGFCVFAGAELRATRHRNGRRRLDDLDPLGELPPDTDNQR